MASDARAIWDSLTAAQRKGLVAYADRGIIQYPGGMKGDNRINPSLRKQGLIKHLSQYTYAGVQFVITDLGRAVVEAGKAGESDG